MFLVWQTSTGWHFTDLFFRNHQQKVGPYATEEEAKRAALGLTAWHCMKMMFT